MASRLHSLISWSSRSGSDLLGDSKTTSPDSAGDESDDNRPLRLLFYGRFERGVSGMQRLFRWPVLLLIFLIIAIELVAYFLLRALIYGYEIIMQRFTA